jgi:hypothetical protein
MATEPTCSCEYDNEEDLLGPFSKPYRGDDSDHEECSSGAHDKCGCDFCTTAIDMMRNCVCNCMFDRCDACRYISQVHSACDCLMQVACVINNKAYLDCVAHVVGKECCMGCVVARRKRLSVCCYTGRFADDSDSDEADDSREH